MYCTLLRIRRWLPIGIVIEREYVLPAAPTREELEACSDLCYMAEWVGSADSSSPVLAQPPRD